MNVRIDRNSKTAAYLQLYGQIKEDIISGVFKYNRKLPSKRTVAEEAEVSIVTVEHAYALLCDEGYVESRERSGYFVIFRASDGFAATRHHTELSRAPQLHESGERYEFPISTLTKTMRRVMSEREDMLLEKSPNAGLLELREAISSYLAGNRGIRADAERIVIGSGAEYLYTLIIELFGKDRIFAIESPSYKKIELVYKASGVRYDSLPLASDGIESTALFASEADVLHTTPYRSFPSGVTATASKRHEYIRWASRGGRYIVEDDFESEFSVSSKPEETLFALSQSDNVIYMNTFSKTISPSLRVGYMVLPERLAADFTEKLGFYSCTVPTFEQLVIAELISSGEFERHVNRVRRKKRRTAAETK